MEDQLHPYLLVVAGGPSALLELALGAERHPPLLRLHRDRQARGHLEVGRGEGERVRAGIEEDSGECRDARSRRHRTLDGLERLREIVTIASELHLSTSCL